MLAQRSSTSSNLLGYVLVTARGRRVHVTLQTKFSREHLQRKPQNVSNTKELFCGGHILRFSKQVLSSRTVNHDAV